MSKEKAAVSLASKKENSSAFKNSWLLLFILARYIIVSFLNQFEQMLLIMNKDAYFSEEGTSIEYQKDNA